MFGINLLLCWEEVILIFLFLFYFSLVAKRVGIISRYHLLSIKEKNVVFILFLIASLYEIYSVAYADVNLLKNVYKEDVLGFILNNNYSLLAIVDFFVFRIPTYLMFAFLIKMISDRMKFKHTEIYYPVMVCVFTYPMLNIYIWNTGKALTMVAATLTFYVVCTGVFEKVSKKRYMIIAVTFMAFIYLLIMYSSVGVLYYLLEMMIVSLILQFLLSYVIYLRRFLRRCITLILLIIIFLLQFYFTRF
jgi:hypothetical protein